MKKRFLALVLVVVLVFSMGSSVFADPVGPWYENTEMAGTTNSIIQTWTVASIATGTALIFSGTAAAWTGIASTLWGNAVLSETHTIYYKVRYYWQPSGDSMYPFRIKQVVYGYSNIERTNFVGLGTRYYLSSQTF